MRLSSVTIASALALSSSSAFAGGYDTPILYSAEHMGLGGAAIGYVDDPSAMFHNPAGLMGTKGLTLMANLTLVTGEITASPDEDRRIANIASDPILALAPLVGVSYDIDDVVAFGLAFYPVASAGAEYNYKTAGTNNVAVRNFTSLRFLEFSPGVAVKIPGTGLSIGAGYRVSLVSLGRQLEVEGQTAQFDVDMSGANFAGFRVGLQYQPIPELELGVVFRSRTATEIQADKGTVLSVPRDDVTTEFVLPAKLGFGLRLNLDPIAVVTDLEYGFYSQNKSNEFLSNGEPLVPAVVNVSNWENAITFRAGVEYGIDNRWFFRGGFLYDGKVSQVDYPSAFGTPPDSTTTITAGFGTKCEDNWELNFAIAHRLGSAKVRKGDDLESCFPCSNDGDYKLSMTGFYVDFTYAFPNL